MASRIVQDRCGTPAGGAVAARRPDAGRWQFAGPRYWPIWACWAWMRVSAWAPLGAAIALHQAIGAIVHVFPTKSRRIVLRNLEMCFPDLSETERYDLSKAHFRALGTGFAECAAAWFAPDTRLRGRFELEGLEHVEAALRKGRGVLLYTGHFTPLEICGRPLRHAIPGFSCLFSRRSNALLDEIQRRGRLRSAQEEIPSDNVRALLASLRRNRVCWYAPDQYPHGRRAVLTPFFGEPAMTNVATSRIARISGAAVVPFSYSRIPGTARYRLSFSPQLERFPSGDVAADARRLVEILEQQIRSHPEQYFWKQKKFKGRPAMPDPYVDPVPRPAPPPAPLREIPMRESAAPMTAKETEGAVDRPFSVVIPLNNEEENVRPLLTELVEALSHRNDYELIVVNDGSTDSTGEQLEQFASGGTPLRLLTHAERRGQSTAIYHGIGSATNEIVLVLDGDLQNDPSDIERLLDCYWSDPARDRLGLIIGHRVTRNDSGLRRLSSRIANSIRARVLRDGTPDTGCGLKLIKRSVFAYLPYFDHMHRFLPALVQSAGYRVVSLPVRHRPRIHGAPHYGVWDRLWVGLVDLFGVAWLARRSMPHDYREEQL